ncbi:PREDICTED: transcription factor GTE7-like isoform X2 [Ipomoea nil]|uniref:transcription factor GTE7-like isoform X2 n=1 Tax=Ipomoea nil TaxID=35883 RepID=UPI0009015225|nr:PREDICTED: transcription factor GTE7-like isoform X2 [Ipomoea nil]
MASAVFAGRNEAHWGDGRVQRAKFTCRPTSNPHSGDRFNHNPGHNNLNRHDTSNKHFKRHFNGPAPPPRPQPMDHESTRPSNPRPNTLIDCSNLFSKEYVTFNLASYSRMQVYELKQRLISDLVRVQGVLKRIETRELECRASLPDFQRREASELPQPLVSHPWPQVNQNCASNNLPEIQAPNVASEHFQSTELGDRRDKRSTGNKLSGKKRAHTLTLDGDGKQPAVKGSRTEKVLTSMMRRCKQILEKLMKRKYGWIFNKPVDVKRLGLHDYNLIIKNPMDLGTVKSKLDRNEYKTPQDFAADVRLTFNNAMIYNPKGEQVHVMAELFLNSFEDMFKTAYQNSEAEDNKAVGPQQMTCDPTEQIVEPGAPKQILIAKKTNSVPSPAMVFNPPVPIRASGAVVSVPTALKSCPQPVAPPKSGKLPKPMVNNPNKRQMTFEEKAKLGLSLQNLPQEKMDHMLQILKKMNLSVSEEGGEIELDIQALDNETLWELHTFVGSQKNALSNVSMQCMSKLTANEPIPQNVVQKINKGHAGEEDVDIGEDIPNSDIPLVVIEKDISGTSSSSASSSSSDSSSSGSSSGSDSEDTVQSPYVEA